MRTVHLSRLSSQALRAAGCLFLLYFTVTAAAEIEPRQARGPEGAWFLLPAAEGAQLEHESGERVVLPLSAAQDLSSLAALGDGWIVAGTILHSEGRRELRLWTGNAERARPLLPPPGQRAFLRDQPVVLARDGKLVGLAWLEGEIQQNLAVMASVWNGKRWGAPERVSAARPGSQLAPAGAVLADGSWLLAWSAVDGEDDEIAWSVRKDGQWSAPRFVSEDNRVPDVRPALVAAPGGALLAWSRYDGETYRVVLARFDGDTFVGERMVDSRPSTAPSFVEDERGPSLLYRIGPTRGWAVAKLDFRGRVEGRSHLETTHRESRPLLQAEPGGELALRFAGAAERHLLIRSQD